MVQNNGAGFLSAAAGGFFGSLGASAWKGATNFENPYAIAASTVAFGALSGGVGAELAGGNFWQGAVTGGIVSGLNHAMHEGMDEDPSKKIKRAAAKGKKNIGKISEYGEAGIATRQLIMTEARSSMTVSERIGTFSKFAAKYQRLSRIRGLLGKANNGLNIFETSSNIFDYGSGEISGASLSYKLGTTAASIGTSSAVGTEFGGPWGAAAGFIVGLGSAAGEIIYNGWNNTILPSISQGTSQINNNHAWTNFHP